MMHCVKIWIERHAHDFGCMLCSYLRSEKKHRYCPAYVTLWTWIRKQHPDNLKKNNNLTIMEVPHHAYLDWNRKNEIQINIGKDIYIRKCTVDPSNAREGLRRRRVVVVV